SIPLTSQYEKIHGVHPTQKPMQLLRRIVAASSHEGDLVLDPFNGSGTTGIAAHLLGRRYIGIDKQSEYLDITIKRLNELKKQRAKPGQFDTNR
ncbi:MAG: site-specific DNA-methyltransferase, partial [Thermoplasmata archaeon HGW-Thermoplasmata-1]